ncbi:MAG: hypothetical protein ACI4CT_09190 [Lachnospiraceae bacterium]
MKKRRVVKREDPVVKALWYGLLLYSFLFEVVGVLLVDEWIPYTLGLFVGVGTDLYMIRNMKDSIDVTLTLEPDDAASYARKRSIFRMLIWIAIAIVSVYLPMVNTVAVIIGFFGLKISAYMVPLMQRWMNDSMKKKEGESDESGS